MCNFPVGNIQFTVHKCTAPIRITMHVFATHCAFGCIAVAAAYCGYSRIHFPFVAFKCTFFIVHFHFFHFAVCIATSVVYCHILRLSISLTLICSSISLCAHGKRYHIHHQPTCVIPYGSNENLRFYAHVFVYLAS